MAEKKEGPVHVTGENKGPVQMAGENKEPVQMTGENEGLALCHERKKKRSPEEKKALLARLKRAEGQIRGIGKMVEEDAYCPDILMQVSAVTSALQGFNKELLACHMRSCVAEDIRNGEDGAIDEFVLLMKKLMR